MMPYSLEVTPRGKQAFEAVARLLPPLTEVFVANLPDQTPDLLIDACARYRRAGFRPVPHLVARNIEGADELRFLLSRLVGDAGVERALVLAGDRDEPAGPFKDALDLLETGLLPEHGIRSVAFACFPEGHPSIPADQLQRALEAKLAAAARDQLDVLLVSQFLFEARPLLDYVRRLRTGGIAAPLRVGLAGPADAETLLKFADELGVGSSKRVVEAKAANPDEREADQSPQRLMSAIVAAQEAEPTLRIEGFHFFAFGSTAETIKWADRHRPSPRWNMPASAPLPLDLKPMEAETTEELPSGAGWQYEPKYDGYRCLAHTHDGRVHLQSRNAKPLERYFPEVASGLQGIPEAGFVLDGELLIPSGSFESLQLRLHPAESRIRLLSEQSPAQLVVFDILQRGGASLLERPLADRRRALEAFIAEAGASSELRLGEATEDEAVARSWLGREGLDGIIAKRRDLPYLPGERAMRKFKLWKTVDCVVAGLYRRGDSQTVEHLLLGLYDEEGRLNYVGRVRLYENAAEIGQLLEPLVGGSGFTGRAPGGKSRWSGKERRPVPLQPVLVAEVSADHITGEHMRHGARLVRWRTDKPPQSCTMDQIR